jgi:hypothetical protein
MFKGERLFQEKRYITLGKSYIIHTSTGVFCKFQEMFCDFP